MGIEPIAFRLAVQRPNHWGSDAGSHLELSIAAAGESGKAGKVVGSATIMKLNVVA